MGNTGKLKTVMVAAIAVSIFALPTMIPAGTEYTFLALVILLLALAAMLTLAIK